MAYGREPAGPGPFTYIFSSIMLALGVAIAGSFIASSIIDAPVRDRTITVTGMASQEAFADHAMWSLTLARSGRDMTALTQAISDDADAVVAYFVAQGFDTSEVTPARMVVTRGTGGDVTLSQTLTIRTKDVALVDQSSRDVSALLREGVALTTIGAPAYWLTDLSDKRAELIAASAQDAVARAQQIAQDTGVFLGPLQAGTQSPVLVIARDIDGEVSAGPLANAGTSSVYKRVVVTTVATFAVE